MQILLFMLGFALFVGLVLVHEFGHYWIARRNGVKTDEFGLGIPPRAWGKKLKSGMILSLNWLPLGGFVKLRGENDGDNRRGSFGAASLGAKSRILLAGVGMNFLTGLVLLTVLAIVGMPKLLTQDNVGQDQFTVASDTKVVHQDVIASYIEPGSPADKIGLSGHDLIRKISNGTRAYSISTSEQLHNATQTLAGQRVNITYKHNSSEVVKTVQLRSLSSIVADLKRSVGLKANDNIVRIQDKFLGDKAIAITSDSQLYNLSQQTSSHTKIYYLKSDHIISKSGTFKPEGYFGISPTDLQLRRSTWSAPIVALGFTKQLIVLTFQGLGHALAGLGSIIAGVATGNHKARVNGQSQATAQVGGPVAIMAVLWNGGALGIYFVLMVIAIVSITLALMNVLPIPALDGGRLFMILVSRLVLRRPLSRRIEERIVGTSMAVLLSLFVLITIVDVRRFL